ncbi:MAG: TRAP transporter large permease subunit [Pseudomonadota bacterium]|nr:TRAP transporter large permease subunit [Pseudomonadota bacterium]
MLLFAVAKVAELPLNRVVRAIVPFYLPLFLALLLVTYVPQISLFLPGLFR